MPRGLPDGIRPVFSFQGTTQTCRQLSASLLAIVSKSVGNCQQVCWQLSASLLAIVSTICRQLSARQSAIVSTVVKRYYLIFGVTQMKFQVSFYNTNTTIVPLSTCDRTIILMPYNLNIWAERLKPMPLPWYGHHDVEDEHLKPPTRYILPTGFTVIVRLSTKPGSMDKFMNKICTFVTEICLMQGYPAR